MVTLNFNYCLINMHIALINVHNAHCKLTNLEELCPCVGSGYSPSFSETSGLGLLSSTVAMLHVHQMPKVLDFKLYLKYKPRNQIIYYAIFQQINLSSSTLRGDRTAVSGYRQVASWGHRQELYFYMDLQI